MSLALARLLQLASPALPVGAYTYSQGLEWAVEAGRVCDEATALEWVGGLLANTVGCFEAPLTASLQRAWMAADLGEVERLNAEFLASRESSELRAETLQMGYSLRRLLHDLGSTSLPPTSAALQEITFPAGWALAAAVWAIDPEQTLIAYLWSWCENQVMAALKAVPLGQTAGQRLLLGLGACLPAIARAAVVLPEECWSNLAPGFALASSRHETQYARLFRS